jgi:hypothetical protein
MTPLANPKIGAIGAQPLSRDGKIDGLQSVSAAERVCDCEEGVQCPNDRNPMFFIQAIYAVPVDLRTSL